MSICAIHGASEFASRDDKSAGRRIYIYIYKRFPGDEVYYRRKTGGALNPNESFPRPRRRTVHLSRK